jgi:hypothetical protein
MLYSAEITRIENGFTVQLRPSGDVAWRTFFAPTLADVARLLAKADAENREEQR